MNTDNRDTPPGPPVVYWSREHGLIEPGIGGSPWLYWDESREEWEELSTPPAGAVRLAPAVEPRVFWPGDEIPAGMWVIARTGDPSLNWCPGTIVDPNQPNPLVEVRLPDFDAAVRAASTRRTGGAQS